MVEVETVLPHTRPGLRMEDSQISVQLMLAPETAGEQPAQ